MSRPTKAFINIQGSRASTGPLLLASSQFYDRQPAPPWVDPIVFLGSAHVQHSISSKADAAQVLTTAGNK